MWIDQLQYMERHGPDHVYDFKGPCVSCRKEVKVTVKGPELFNLNCGMQRPMIQDALVSNTDAEREFLMSGLCDKCFKKATKDC